MGGQRAGRTTAVRFTRQDQEAAVQIDKAQILELLKSQGKQDSAQQADAELPDQVDTDQHANLLSKYGINVQDLLGKLGGGGGIGGLLGG